ncbi:MAG: methyl-accepting chemotaxis protein [Lysobacteraceae bacterium]
MDRLRFTRKLITIGLIFVAAIAVLTVQLLPLLRFNIDFIDKERRGLQVAQPLGQAIAAVADLRAGAGSQASVAFEQAWKGVLDWHQANAEDMPQTESLQRIEAQWKALGTAATSETINAFMLELITLGEAVADASNLTLDPEINAYVLMDAVFFKHPGAVNQLAQLRDSGARLQAMSATEPAVAELGRAMGMLQVARNLLDRAQPGVERVMQARPAVASALREKFASAQTALQSFMQSADVWLSGASSGDATAFRSSGDAAVRALLDLRSSAINALDAELSLRQSGYEHNRTVALVALVVSSLTALYFFFGFARSLSATLRGLSRAARALAAGEFPQRIDLQSRDELQDIADELDQVTGVLRRFEDEQHDMFVKHQTGEVSHRINEARFSGAYAGIAKGVNDLIASHIAVKHRIVEVASDYARGNFSDAMDRLPGEEASISSAMDAVRDSLSRLRDEIVRLGDAAAAGELHQRGDESAFEFNFRDMVSGLNRLMAVTQEGVQGVSVVMQAVASGDLRQRMQGEYRGEFRQLQVAANQSVEQLAQMVRQINETAQSIYTASGEIVSGNDDLSQRTEEQAASLEQTASSMEELTATVRLNADNARLADQHSQGAAELAERGADVVSGVVQTMHEIEASSRRIVDIIGVIDGIAFQTNILALNAAVEAARAGDQGRGFAVVASEVRSLAQRSAQAAKEIKGLIDDSVNKVQSGSALVDTAGSTISDVRTSVRQAATLIGEIASASGEQRAGIEQVNATVTQMDQVTQQNAALVEEATAAARSLEEQADQLARMVAAFKL